MVSNFIKDNKGHQINSNYEKLEQVRPGTTNNSGSF